MNDDSFMKNFEERMSAKKAAEPKLHKFEAEFRIGILAVDEETAAGTVEIVSKVLNGYSDLEVIEGRLK